MLTRCWASPHALWDDVPPLSDGPAAATNVGAVMSPSGSRLPSGEWKQSECCWGGAAKRWNKRKQLNA